MGGSGNEIPASIATAVHSALLTNHPDILQQQFVVHASKVGVGNLCTFESSNPEDKRRFLCLGATVLNKSDFNKFLGFEQTARGAPRNQVNRLDADKRKGSRPRVWSSKHNPGETTKTTGFSKLVIFAAIKHFWDNKQTHETLTGIHCRCFKSYCNWFSYSYQLSLFFSDLWQRTHPCSCISWHHNTTILTSGERARVVGTRMPRNVPYKSQTC